MNKLEKLNNKNDIMAVIMFSSFLLAITSVILMIWISGFFMLTLGISYMMICVITTFGAMILQVKINTERWKNKEYRIRYYKNKIEYYNDLLIKEIEDEQ